MLAPTASCRVNSDEGRFPLSLTSSTPAPVGSLLMKSSNHSGMSTCFSREDLDGI